MQARLKLAYFIDLTIAAPNTSRSTGQHEIIKDIENTPTIISKNS